MLAQNQRVSEVATDALFSAARVKQHIPAPLSPAKGCCECLIVAGLACKALTAVVGVTDYLRGRLILLILT